MPHHRIGLERHRRNERNRKMTETHATHRVARGLEDNTRSAQCCGAPRDKALLERTHHGHSRAGTRVGFSGLGAPACNALLPRASASLSCNGGTSVVVDHLNVRHLRYFVLLAQEGHFGRAARAAHVSQPALSAAIRMLEREFGVALVHRSRQRYETLTHEGQQGKQCSGHAKPRAAGIALA